MSRPLAASCLLSVIALVLAACGGGKEHVRPPQRQASVTAQEARTVLAQAARAALLANHRLSVLVLWRNEVPPWATRGTRGPALAALRAAAAKRRARGIRVRMLAERYEILSLRLDPSYLRASARVFDRQRLQPAGPDGRPLGRPVALAERARVELRRVGRSSRFVVWKLEALP